MTMFDNNHHEIFRSALAGAAMLLALSTPAFAQCSLPDAGEGAQIYNSTHDVMQYCDGADWISMDGSVIAPASPDNLGNHTATANLEMAGFKVTNLGDPTANEDAATKAYVDSVTGVNETDPKVGTVTDGKWCQGDGTAIQCTYDAPSVGAGGGQCVAFDQKSAGTNGGTTVYQAWTKRNLTDVTCQDMAGVSISSGSVLMPLGLYYVDVLSNYYSRAWRVGTRLSVGGQAQYLPFTHAGASIGSNVVRMAGFMNVKSAGAAVELQYFDNYSGGGTDALGLANNMAVPETYVSMYIKKISDTPVYDNCTLDGQDVDHGDSYTFYSAQVHTNCVGQSQTRTCTDGAFDGSPTYQYANCIAEDATVDPFNFTDQTNVAWNTVINSNIVTINGINTGTAVSVTGDGSPQIQIAGGSWVTSGTISNGQTLRVRTTSANTASTARNVTVNINGVTDAWAVTTNNGNCTLDGVTVNNGNSRYFYEFTLHATCNSYRQNRTCTNGILSGSGTYQYANCAAPLNCTQDGVTVNHNDNRDFYSSTTHANCTANRLNRTCNNGNLSGSATYQYANCTVVDPCTTGAIGTACSDGARYAGMSGGVRVYVRSSDSSSGAYYSTPGTANTPTSTTNGLTNTDTVISTLPGGHSYPAFTACRAHGSQWYLPSSGELALLWTNRVAIDLTAINVDQNPPPSTTNFYWASDQSVTSTGKNQRFYDGLTSTSGKVTTHRIRCFRR